MIPTSSPRAKALPATFVPFFQPGSVKGFKSFPIPSSLDEDTAALLQNIRLGDASLRARWGDVVISTSLAGDIRGVFEGTVNGTPLIFAATATTGKVSVFKSADEGVTWASITPTSGKFGDTRLTDTGNPVFFGLTQDNTYGTGPFDTIIIQNGVDFPRIYQQSVMSVLTQPEAIPNSANVQQRYGFANFFPVNDSATQSFTTPPPTGAVPMVISNPSDFIQLVIPASATQNGTATVTWSGSLDFSAATQFVMITDQLKDFAVTSYNAGTGASTFPASSFVAGVLAGQTVKVTAGTGAGQQFTVASNTTTVLIPTTIPVVSLDNTSVVSLSNDPQLLYQNLGVSFTDASGTTAVLFNPVATSVVGNIVALQYDSSISDTALQVAYPLPAGSTIDLAHIEKVVFTYLPATAIPTTLEIYLMAAGGATQGGARFGIAFQESIPRATGPGLVITNTQAQPLGDIGSGGNPLLVLQEDQRFYYDYEIRLLGPDTADVANGVDTVLVFRQDVGQSGFYYATKAPVASYSGSAWVAVANPIIVGLTVSPSEPTGALVNFAFPLPDGASTTLPVGTAMLFLDGRYFVCSGSLLWVSDFSQPFLYTMTQRFLDPGIPDPVSGTTLLKSGETLQQIVGLGASPAGSSSLGGPLDGTGSVYFWTDRNFYKLLGLSAQGLNQSALVGTHGTLSPYSPARNRTGLYWLDHLGQICFYTSGFAALYGVTIPDQQINVLSLNKVDNQIPYIPANRKAWVSGACSDNRYYLSFTAPGGSLNLQALVFSEPLTTFDSLDDFNIGASVYNGAFILPYYSATSGYIKTIVFSDNAGTTKVNEHEQPNSQALVNWGFTSREIINGISRTVDLETVQVTNSGFGTGAFSMTVNRVFDGNEGSPVTSTLNFTGGVTQSLTDGPIGGSGLRVYLNITSRLPGGTQILAIGSYMKQKGATGYVRSS